MVNEHIVIAEAALGRFLPAGVEVHHVDENRRNNARSNLVICENHQYHRMLHARARVARAGGDPNTQKICAACGVVKQFEAFSLQARNRTSGRQPVCRECDSVRQRARREAA